MHTQIDRAFSMLISNLRLHSIYAIIANSVRQAERGVLSITHHEIISFTQKCHFVKMTETAVVSNAVFSSYRTRILKLQLNSLKTRNRWKYKGIETSILL